MAWKDGFVIEYAPKSRKGKNCRNCIHANMDDKSCSKRPIVFWEDGYDNWKSCEYFKLPRLVRRTDGKSTDTGNGYKPINQPVIPAADHVKNVIPEPPAKKTVSRDIINKRRIVKARKSHLLDDEARLFADVEDNNFIELQDPPITRKICNCGGTLIVSKKNEVYFHIHNERAFVKVKALISTECKRLYVLRQNILNAIKGMQL